MSVRAKADGKYTAAVTHKSLEVTGCCIVHHLLHYVIYNQQLEE